MRRLIAGVLALALCGFSHRTVLTVNPNPTLQAQQLLIYLRDIGLRSNHRVITGQHIGAAAPGGGTDPPYGYNTYWIGLNTAVGAYPGIIGIDLNDYNSDSPGTPVDYTVLVAEAEAAAANGSIIEVTWHAKNPWTGGKYSDNGGCSSGGNALVDLANPAKPVYATWHAQVDAIDNNVLLPLQARGIPVIWRPFLEANGGDGWWWNSGCNPTFLQTIFATIWNDLVNYQIGKGVNNALFAYSPGEASTGVNADPYSLYPGNATVDIIGQDNYRDATSPTPESTFTDYSQFLATGKLLIYGERGPPSAEQGTSLMFETLIPGSVANNASSRPVVSSFMAWTAGDAIVNNLGASTLMGDSNAANQADTARFWNCVATAPPTFAAIEACVQL